VCSDDIRVQSRNQCNVLVPIGNSSKSAEIGAIDTSLDQSVLQVGFLIANRVPGHYLGTVSEAHPQM